MLTNATALHACLYCGTRTSAPGPYCCEACRLLSDTGWTQFLPEEPILAPYKSFEDAALARSFNHSSDPSQNIYEFFVEGLQCSSCVHLLESMPEFFSGVVDARLNFASSHLLLKTRPDLTLAQLLTWIHRMGYEAHPLASRQDLSRRLRREDRDQMRRLGIAGAAAGNIMLLTVGIYAGASPELSRAFHWISLILFLPVALYAALPIYRSAWSGLKTRSFNVDVPLTLAFWAGSAASIWNLVRGEGSIYFDSSAGFLFLILISRWLLKKSQRRWIESPVLELPWTKHHLRVRAGDRIRLSAGQWVPVDGVLLSEASDFDTSWVTGESLPRESVPGAAVLAGFRALSDDVVVEARSSVADSSLARQQQEAESHALGKSPRLGQFDVAARWLLGGVTGLAVLILLLGPSLLGLSADQAFERALSLLIVACPCALAFGGPLAYAAAIRRAARDGILVKNAETFDRLRACRHLVFDKTGTLTEGRLQLVSQVPALVPDWVRELVLALEKNSTHPVAQAFRASWPDVSEHALNVHDVHEVPGEKVFGVFEGRLYSLKKPLDTGASGLRVVLEQDMAPRAEFVFEDQLRPEAREVLSSLADRFGLHISSGDRDERVDAMVRELRVPGLEGQGDRSPAQKIEDVQAHTPCVMIGDGLNDSGALAAADVGICMKGSIERGLRTANVYFMEPGLRPLLKLVRIDERLQLLLRRNLSFALAYNIGAGAAALLGLVTPLTAAVLMPLSSVLILLSTWEASR